MKCRRDGDRSLQFSILNEEFLVSATHHVALITSLPLTVRYVFFLIGRRNQNPGSILANINKTLSLYKGLKVRLPGLTPGKELASVLFADATSSNCGESIRAMSYQVARGNTVMAGVMT